MGGSENPFQIPVDKQLGELLAFIILFQKKIQELRVRLAGNEEFHSRLAFHLLDTNKKNVVYPEGLVETLNEKFPPSTIGQTEAFCRKYTTNGFFSYDEFIKFLTPRTNKVLAQRLLIRTYRVGTQLPLYIVKVFFELFYTAIKMITVTEGLRQRIQENSDLTHVELLEFFRRCLSSREKLFFFINESTEGSGEQYDFSLKEMELLCHHVKGSCDLEDITDNQIKEIICPIDMNYKKANSNTASRGFYDSGRTAKNYFKTSYAAKQNNSDMENMGNKTMNFLRTTYKQTSANFMRQKPVRDSDSEKDPKINARRSSIRPSQREIGASFLDEQVPKREPNTLFYRGSKHSPKKQRGESGQSDERSPYYNLLSGFKNKQFGRENMKAVSFLGGSKYNQEQPHPQNSGRIGDSVSDQSSFEPRYDNLYIDRFVDPTGSSEHRVQKGGFERDFYQPKPMEKFDDDFVNNYSEYSQENSKGSAFIQY